MEKKRNTVTTFDKSSQHLKNPFKVYQLDFGGRVTQESAKNFQIEYLGKQVCVMNYFVITYLGKQLCILNMFCHMTFVRE